VITNHENIFFLLSRKKLQYIFQSVPSRVHFIVLDVSFYVLQISVYGSWEL